MQTEKIFGRKGSEKKAALLGVLVTKKIYTTRREPKHLFRKNNGFGLSNSLLKRLYKADTDEIHFTYDDPEGLIVYAISFEDFRKFGTEVDYGERQTICGLERMHIFEEISTKSKVVAELR